MGIMECQVLVIRGAQTIRYQCQKVSAAIKSQNTECGIEPTASDYSLTLDGNNISANFILCQLHGHSAQIHQQTYE